MTTAGGLAWTVDSTLSSGTERYQAFISAEAPSGLATSTALAVTLTGTGTIYTCRITVLYTSGITRTVTHTAGGYGEGANTTGLWPADTPSNVTLTKEGLILAGACADFAAGTGTSYDAPATELADNYDTTPQHQHSAGYRIETTPGDYTINGDYGADFNRVAVGIVVYEAAGAAAAATPPRSFNPIPFMKTR